MSLISFIEYALNSLGIQYILTVKLQTVCLEGQFGKWRETNGGSFHLTYCQVLSKTCAKRALNSLKLTGEIANLNLIDINDNDILEDLNFLDHLEINMIKLNQRAFDYNYALKIVYIGGYILFKNIKNDSYPECYGQLIFNEDIDSEFSFSKNTRNVYSLINEIDRYSLKKPRNLFVLYLYDCFIAFKEQIFPRISKNLNQISSKKIINFFVDIAYESEFYDYIIICECHDLTFLKKCLKNFTNILLNNYTKIVNDLFDSDINKRVKISNPNSAGSLQMTKFY